MLENTARVPKAGTHCIGKFCTQLPANRQQSTNCYDMHTAIGQMPENVTRDFQSNTELYKELRNPPCPSSPASPPPPSLLVVAARSAPDCVPFQRGPRPRCLRRRMQCHTAPSRRRLRAPVQPEETVFVFVNGEPLKPLSVLVYLR